LKAGNRSDNWQTIVHAWPQTCIFAFRLNACYMQYELSSLSEGELVKLYYQINKELKEQFLSKVSWDQQQETINNLTRISKELTKRKTKLTDELKQESLSA
jgi:hypothetical protein